MSMALRLLSLAISIVSVCLTGAIPASGRHQVVVDVIVTDSNNQPVNGLGASDFLVFEGSKVQQIRSFEAHRQDASGTSNPRELPENTFTNGAVAESKPINVILLDQMTTSAEDQTLAATELIAYLEHKPPETRFAIFTYRKNRDTLCIPCDGLRMLQGITSDKRLLIGALERSLAQPQEPTRRKLATEVEDTSMGALAEIGNFLHELPGRKELIWLSDNFDAAPVAQTADIWFPPKFKGWQDVAPLSKVQILHLAASRLAISRVAVYPVDLSGRSKRVESERLCTETVSGVGIELYTQSQDYISFYQCTSTDGIRIDNVAAKSGGQAFHHRGGIREEIARAVADGENYYTLSYSPTKTEFDGKLRTIRVAVNGKPYRVRFRQWYFADDPSSLYRPVTMSSPGIVLPGGTITNPWTAPWKVGRVSGPDPAGPGEPIDAAMRYGGPELDGLIFDAHLTAKGKPVKATGEQLKQLANYESFRYESAERHMRNLTKAELKTRHQGQTLLSELPPPDQLYLQAFSIDYSIAAIHFGLTAAADGKQVVNLEIAVLAFDDRGRRVTGVKDTASCAMDTAQLQNLAECRLQQTLDVPERASVLRIAARDVSRNKVGSVEIPIWAISNPYQRRHLDIPIVAQNDR